MKPPSDPPEERSERSEDPARTSDDDLPVWPTRQSRAVAKLAALTFGASLFLPAILLYQEEPVRGYEVLFLGWLGGIFGNSIAWYANPLLGVAIIFYGKGYPGCAIGFAAGALLLAMTSLAATEWWLSESHGTKITGLGWGFIAWLASIVLFGFAAYLSFSSGRARHSP